MPAAVTVPEIAGRCVRNGSETAVRRNRQAASRGFALNRRDACARSTTPLESRSVPLTCCDKWVARVARDSTRNHQTPNPDSSEGPLGPLSQERLDGPRPVRLNRPTAPARKQLINNVLSSVTRSANR
jgi:hypothetical protein